MADKEKSEKLPATCSPLEPAEPLWRVAPTRGDDGRCLADFMMLVPRLAGGEPAVRGHVSDTVRDVCKDFGDAVAFAEVNYKLNILWISVNAEPGLTARVAAEIRQRIPDALLIGGQLGAVPGLPQVKHGWRARWRKRLQALPRASMRRLSGRRD